jgi:hypothetical protein
MKFSPETIRKARKELGEDEQKKKDSLQKFRDWLKVHPFIKSCCTDDVFLLTFLRAKKYWNDEAFRVLENYLIFRHKNKEWFDLSDEKVSRYRELTRSGYMFNCDERNGSDKSAYMICNMAQLNLDKFTVDELFHCYFTNTMMVLLDENFQVHGGGGLANMENASAKQIAIYPVGQVISFTKYLVNANPIRFAGIQIVGAPSYANQLVNLFKMTLSEKLKNRVHAFKNVNELHKMVDKSCLPSEMGGKVTQNELIERHLRNFEEKLPILRRIADFELIVENIDEKLRVENVGNFRKLDID